MPTTKRTISVRLDDLAKLRVERAAKLLKQSSGAFLEKAGDQQARQVLLEWASDQHRKGNASFSELAAETGLAIEEIMVAMASDGESAAFDAFLASCRSVAEATNNPGFLQEGRRAVRLLTRERLTDSPPRAIAEKPEGDWKL